jgi:hypothetical protein
MKRVLLFLFLFSFFALPARSQVIVDVLNNTIYHYQYTWGPTWYGYYNGFYVDQIYTAQELIAAGAPVGGGKIPAIWLYPTYLYNYSGGPPPLTIKMSHTSAAVTTPNDYYVYNGPPHPPRVARWGEKVVYETTAFASPTTTFAWWRIPFDNVFVWDGISNIVVTYCFNIQNHVAYPNYSNFFYVQGGYTPNYSRMVDQTYWYGASTSYNLPPSDWCENPPIDVPPLYTAPYYEGYRYSYMYNMRQDIRYEICNQDPLLYDMTVPGMHYLPGTLPVSYSVGRASGTFNSAVTIKIYRPDGSFVKSESFQVPIDADIKSGTYLYSMMGVAPGYYRIEATFNGLDECGNYEDHFVNRAIMILEPGSTPCEVWPGDVNNDGIVNYGDRADLNTYIHEAMLNSAWLQGPARYRVDMDINPLTYLTWEAQYSVPWQTPDGCFMDTDGNGVVNNFDYIAIKMNWNRTRSAIPPKQHGTVAVATFAMDQNYPNPFNPTTSISYTLPERSDVRLQVYDMFGRELATLVNGQVEAGSHTANFDATALSSGQYIARVNMSGLETGYTFSKTIKMTLSK